VTTDLLVTQVRSSIGAKPKHRGTLRALGLGRIGKSNTLPDRPEIRGMIAKVPHLISVEEQAAETKAEAPVKKTTAKKPAAKAAKKTTAKKAAKAAPAKAVAKRAPTGRGGERAEGGAAAGGASTEAKKQPAKATGATKKSATEQES
jgi:large subunit ribosomal protein L30